MSTFEFRGQQVPLITSVDDLEVDDAETMEDLFGVDLRDVGQLSLTKQLRLFVLLSVRRVDPTATPADCGKVKLGPLLKAFTEATAPRPPVELTGAMTVPLTVTDGPAAGPVAGGEVLSPTSAGSEDSTPLPA